VFKPNRPATPQYADHLPDDLRCFYWRVEVEQRVSLQNEPIAGDLLDAMRGELSIPPVQGNLFLFQFG
jgi:hypothetical protein